jgi:long-chain acyl-CoA synthetase
MNYDRTDKSKMAANFSLHGADGFKPSAATLCAMFDHAVAAAPDSVALRHLDAVLTYRDLGRAVEALAQRLATMVEPGETVALILPNSIEFHLAYFAAVKVLAAPALLNPVYPAAQLSPLLREAIPRAVLCAPTTREMVAGLAGDLGIPGVVCLGQDITVPELIAEAEAPVCRRTATPADPAALFFSGGTTGLPKAVEHSHGRLVTAVRCVEYMWPTRTDGEVFLPVAPFSHIYGFVQGVLVLPSTRGENGDPGALPTGAQRRAARTPSRDFLLRGTVGHLYGDIGSSQSARRRSFGPQNVCGGRRTLPGRAYGALAACHGT